MPISPKPKPNTRIAASTPWLKRTDAIALAGLLIRYYDRSPRFTSHKKQAYYLRQRQFSQSDKKNRPTNWHC
jgi:hypothetical protein